MSYLSIIEVLTGSAVSSLFFGNSFFRIYIFGRVSSFAALVKAKKVLSTKNETPLVLNSSETYLRKTRFSAEKCFGTSIKMFPLGTCFFYLSKREN
jgi:hypothetical protein